MPSEEVIRLMLQMGGQESVTRMESEVDTLKAKLEGMTKAWREGEFATANYLSEVAPIERELVRTQEALDMLKGKPGGAGGNGGQGLLGASYAVQDFVSVLSGGGGLGRALGAVSNNVGPVLTALGAGSGLAGMVGLVFVGITALIPLIEKFFDGFGGEKAELAKETLKEIESRIRSINDAYRKLVERPSDAEETSAKGVADYLGQRGVAPAAARGLAQTMTADEITEAMKQRAKNDQGEVVFTHAEARAADARAEAARAEAGRLGRLFETGPEVAQYAGTGKVPGYLARARADADKAEAEAQIARKRVAEIESHRLVAEASQATPAGRAARQRLERAGTASPQFFPSGFGGEMRALGPEQISQDEAEADAWLARTEEWARQAQRRREQAAAAKRARQEKERHDKEVAQAEADAAKVVEDMQKAEDRDLQRGIKEGRQAGAAAAKQKGQPDSLTKGLDLGHLPMTPLNATPEQAERIAAEQNRRLEVDQAHVAANLIRNQDMLEARNRQIWEQLKRASDNTAASIAAGRSASSMGFQN
jgi:hypothetical protein